MEAYAKYMNTKRAEMNSRHIEIRQIPPRKNLKLVYTKFNGIVGMLQRGQELNQYTETQTMNTNGYNTSSKNPIVCH